MHPPKFDYARPERGLDDPVQFFWQIIRYNNAFRFETDTELRIYWSWRIRCWFDFCINKRIIH